MNYIDEDEKIIIKDNLEEILDLLYGKVNRNVYETIKVNVENIEFILDIE